MCMCLGINPLRAEAYSCKGEYLIRIGNVFEGMADLQLAIRLGAADPEAWFKLGVAYCLCGDYSRATLSLGSAMHMTNHRQAEIAAWYCISLAGSIQFERAANTAKEALDDGLRANGSMHARLCLLYAGESTLVEALGFSSDAHEHTFIGYGAYRMLLATDKVAQAKALLGSLSPFIDEHWCGYAENAVRAAL